MFYSAQTAKKGQKSNAWVLGVGFFVSLFLPAFPVSAATEKVLPVPFTAQAPYGDWSQPWQDACEETAITMVHNYYGGRTLNQADARHGILQIFNLKHKFLGRSYDETIGHVAYLINNFLPWEVETVRQPTLAMIRAEIDNGHPVIVPVAGRQLQNPHFQGDGPPYHMVVISGYDDAAREFITEDPGTSFGHRWRYGYDLLLEANHDFVPGDPTAGERLMLFTRPSVVDTAGLDGDGDGVVKIDELRAGSNLGVAETGESLPPVPQWSLIKTASSDALYVVEGNLKRYIVNLDVLRRHAHEWGRLLTVSQEVFDSLKRGSDVVY